MYNSTEGLTTYSYNKIGEAGYYWTRYYVTRLTALPRTPYISPVNCHCWVNLSHSTRKGGGAEHKRTVYVEHRKYQKRWKSIVI